MFLGAEEMLWDDYHIRCTTRDSAARREWAETVKTETNLGRIRRAAGYSQADLSRLSGVNVRNIQLYEQRAQDINRASAASLAALSRSLACSIEDLMEQGGRSLRPRQAAGHRNFQTLILCVSVLR